MSFAGKFELKSQENFQLFMRAIGLPDDLRQKNIKSICDIEVKGDHFKITSTTGTKVLVNSFTIGQEEDIETMTGEKVKAVVKREGDKLITTLKGIESVTELVDADTIENTMTFDGLTYKRTHKRV